MQTLTWPDWTALLVYLGMLVAVALHHSRKLKAQDDLFLAGRSMSRWPVAISMYTAIFSTNTLLGVIGWLNRPDGTIWIGLQNIGIIMAVPLVVALYPNVFFRLRITTAYEYLERRFDYPVRAMATVLFISSRVMWMATILYGGSLVVSHMTGLEQKPELAVALIVVLGTSLAIAGGMRAVIWTDVAQFCVLFGSTILLAVIAIQQSGGIESVFNTAAAAGRFRPPPLFSISDNLSRRQRTLSRVGIHACQRGHRPGLVTDLPLGQECGGGARIPVVQWFRSQAPQPGLPYARRLDLRLFPRPSFAGCIHARAR